MLLQQIPGVSVQQLFEAGLHTTRYPGYLQLNWFLAFLDLGIGHQGASLCTSRSIFPLIQVRWKRNASQSGDQILSTLTSLLLRYDVSDYAYSNARDTYVFEYVSRINILRHFRSVDQARDRIVFRWHVSCHRVHVQNLQYRVDQV